MGTVRLVLRIDKADKEGSSPIQLIYQLSGKRKYFQTREKVRAENWDATNQQTIYLDKKAAKKVLPLVPYDLLPSSNEVEDINTELRLLKKRVADIEEKTFKHNNILYNAEMIIEELSKDNRTSLIKPDVPKNQVFDFIDKYIEDNKSSREPGSLSVYKSLKNHLQNFQIEKRKIITFNDMDYSFFKELENFLINVRSQRTPNGLGNITIAKQLSTLKTFLNYARMHGIEVQNKYKDFKIKKESLEVIALSNDEFETLYSFDLSNNKKLDQVRDVFCFSCATGLRYSDLAQLKREHIKKDEIRLTVTKTKQKLSIPLNPFSHAILEKYSSMARPLPIISNQKMNDYIKELCKLVEINDIIQIVRFRGTKREEISYPKHELISVHTGRKTFCTLSLEKGMSAEEVMKISGHKDYSSFKRYINITEQRSKVVMGKAWGPVPASNLKIV